MGIVTKYNPLTKRYEAKTSSGEVLASGSGLGETSRRGENIMIKRLSSEGEYQRKMAQAEQDAATKEQQLREAIKAAILPTLAKTVEQARTQKDVIEASKRTVSETPTTPSSRARIPVEELKRSEIEEYIKREERRETVLGEQSVKGLPPRERTVEDVVRDLSTPPSTGVFDVKEEDPDLVKFAKGFGAAVEASPFAVVSIPASSGFGFFKTTTEPVETFSKTWEYGVKLITERPYETLGSLAPAILLIGGPKAVSVGKKFSMPKTTVKIEVGAGLEKSIIPSFTEKGTIEVFTRQTPEGTFVSKGNVKGVLREGMLNREGVSTRGMDIYEFVMTTKPDKAFSVFETDMIYSRAAKAKMDKVTVSTGEGKVTTFRGKEGTSYSKGIFREGTGTGQITLGGEKTLDGFVAKARTAGIEIAEGKNIDLIDVKSTIENPRRVEKSQVGYALEEKVKIQKGEDIYSQIDFFGKDVKIKPGMKFVNKRQTGFEYNVDKDISNAIINTDLMRKIEIAQKKALELLLSTKSRPEQFLKPVALEKAQLATPSVKSTGSVSGAVQVKLNLKGFIPIETQLEDYYEYYEAIPAKEVKDFVGMKEGSLSLQKTELLSLKKTDSKTDFRTNKMMPSREIFKEAFGEKSSSMEKDLTSYVPAMDEKVGTTQSQKTNLRYEQIKITRQRPRIRERYAPRPPMFPKKPLTPLPPIQSILMDDRRARLKVTMKKTGYDVQVRKGGKFITITKRPLAKLAALTLGGKEVIETPRASFRLVPSKEPPSVGTIDKGILQRIKTQFRKPKGKSRLPVDTYIEKTAFRIDTPGELRGITMKGLQSAKSNSEIRKFIRGR